MPIIASEGLITTQESLVTSSISGFRLRIRGFGGREVEEVEEYFEIESPTPTKVDLAPVDFIKQVRGIEDVQAVIWKYTDEITYLWTVISRLDEVAAGRIYETEEILYRKYPRARFNFYVFSLPQDKVIEQSIPEEFELLYEKQ